MQYKVGRCLLRYRLRQRKISQRELATKIGMKKSQVSQYVNNNREMTLSTAKTIAMAIGCVIDDLYMWDSVESRRLDE